jgi:hypothetical protein
MPPLTLMTDAPPVPEDQQWLYTAVRFLLEKVQRLEKQVADIEGRERV